MLIPDVSLDASSFQFFASNLPSATNFKAKLYAKNSKGRSNHVWLNAQTLRPAERLVDSQSNNGVNGFQAAGPVLRGKPAMIALLIGAGVVTLIVIALIVIAVARVRRRSSEMSVTHNGSNLPSHTNARPPPSSDEQSPGTGGATLFGDEDEEPCCCEDDCCDEMLLTTNHTEHSLRQYVGGDYQQNGNGKGPDIIPAFGYCSSSSGIGSSGGGLDNKQFLPFGKQGGIAS